MPPALFLYSHGFPDPAAMTTADRLAFHSLAALAARGPVDLLALIPHAKRGMSVPPAVASRCRRVAVFPAPAGVAAAVGSVARGLAVRRPPMLSLKRSAGAAAFLARALQRGELAISSPYSPLALADLPEALGAARRAGAAAPRIVLATEEVLWRAWEGYSWRHWRALGPAILLHSRFAGWMACHERRLGCLADRVLCLSDREAESMRRLDPAIRTARWPLAVDTADFCPGDDPLPAEPEILFTGFFGHPPNRAAAVELVRDVLPRVRTALPQARLHLAGRGVRTLRGLAEGPHLRLSDSVPSLVPLYRRAVVAAGPLRSGEGVRGKFLEALACGCPVVTTALGASGIEAGPAEGLFEAETPDAMAARVTDLLAAPARLGPLRAAAADAMRRRHSLDAWRRALDGILDGLSAAG